MTTTKSFSKTGRRRKIFAATLRRQLPFAITSFILLFAFIVLPYLVDAPSHMHYATNGWTQETLRAFYTGRFQSGVYVEQELSGVVAVILALMGFAGALAGARYLHSKKMTDLYHSLPLRRGQLLLTNMAATLTAILGPYLLLTALTAGGLLLSYGRYGCFGLAFLQFIVMDVLLVTLYVLVVYLLTTLVAVNVGTTLDALMVTGVLGFAPSIVYAVGGFLWESLYYGANFRGQMFLTLNPFLFFMKRFSYTNESYYAVGTLGEGSFHSYWQVLPDYPKICLLFAGWLVVAALLLWAAIFCYRRRRSETAGQTQPRGVLQTATKCFASFCGAAVCYIAFYDSATAVQLFAMLVGGVCIGLIAELLLSRTVRFVRRNIAWFAGTGLFCCIAVLALGADLFGYIGRVPSPESVSAVQISYAGRYGERVGRTNVYYYGYNWRDYESVTLTDPEAIAIVTDAHRQTVDHYQRYQYDNWMVYAGLNLSYSLSGGGSLNRSYWQMDEQAYIALSQLEGNGDFITQTHPLFVLDKYLGGGQEDFVRKAEYIDLLGNAQPLSLDSGRLSELIEAAKADSLAQPIQSILENGSPSTGFLRLTYEEGMLDDAGVWLRDGEIWVELGDWSTSTAKVLAAQNIDTSAPDAAQVERVLLAGAVNISNSMYGTNRRAVTVTPGSADGYEYNIRRFTEGDRDYAGDFLELRDASSIRSVLAAGRNTALVSEERLAGYVTAVYDLGGERYSMQLVSIDDLPAALQSQARELAKTYLNWDYGDEWYNDYLVELAEEYATY